jgi:hypothetical protein
MPCGNFRLRVQHDMGITGYLVFTREIRALREIGDDAGAETDSALSVDRRSRGVSEFFVLYDEMRRRPGVHT